MSRSKRRMRQITFLLRRLLCAAEAAHELQMFVKGLPSAHVPSRLPNRATFSTFGVSRLSTATPRSPPFRCFSSSSCTAQAAKPPAAPRSRPDTIHTTSKSRSFSWSGALLLIPPVIAAYLGNWQLDRKKWKEDLLDHRTRMLNDQPINLNNAEVHTAAAHAQNNALKEYQRVSCRGSFVDQDTVFIGPRPRTINGVTTPGFLAITPMHLEGTDHRIILVLRGWVPATWRKDTQGEGEDITNTSSRGTRTLSRIPKAPVATIHGIVSKGEASGRSSFVPDNLPDKGQWYYIDPEGIADSLHLPKDTFFIEAMGTEHIDDAVLKEDRTRVEKHVPTTMEVLGGRGVVVGGAAEEADQYPLPRREEDLMVFSVMPKDHRNYAATWFTLSVATMGLAVRALKRR